MIACFPRVNFFIIVTFLQVQSTHPAFIPHFSSFSLKPLKFSSSSFSFIHKKKKSLVSLNPKQTEKMGFSKEEKTRRISRGFKTVFFLITMVISFLVFSAPVFFVIADTLLPTALLSASIPPSSSSLLKTLSSHFSNYDFRYSLIDIPLISIIRSAVIICKFHKNS